MVDVRSVLPILAVIAAALQNRVGGAGDGERQRLVGSTEAGDGAEQRAAATRRRAVSRAADRSRREPAPRRRAHAHSRPAQGPRRQARRARQREQTTFGLVCRLLAKFHYPTGPERNFLRPGSPRKSVGSVRVSDKVRAGPRGSGRARVVEFSLSALHPRLA